jgi:hypothetical protein
MTPVMMGTSQTAHLLLTSPLTTTSEVEEKVCRLTYPEDTGTNPIFSHPLHTIGTYPPTPSPPRYPLSMYLIFSTLNRGIVPKAKKFWKNFWG